MSSSGPLTDQGMENRVRDYFADCNEGDADAIASHFVEDAVHYFPPGMNNGPYRGARTIGEQWKQFVENFNSSWTVDRLMTDAATETAVLEWTYFQDGLVLRGCEWHEFDGETGLIQEIRAYYASPIDSDRECNELSGFDYQNREYPIEPPTSRDGP